jgi:hypothetical protein
MIRGEHIQQAFGGFGYAFGVGGVGVSVVNVNKTDAFFNES